ncbi:MAG: small multi-drug export protein [Thermoplasmatota archaeon]
MKAEQALPLVGATIVVGLTAQWLVLLAFDPAAARGIAAGVTAEVLTGREGGIPVGLQAGAPPLLMFEFSVGQDLVGVCFGYPLFLYALHRYHDRDNFAMRRVRAIEAAAERRRHFVDRWGPLGLFAFMLVPFLVNGPLVGAVLGRLTGIPTKHLILPIIAATTVAAAAWTFALDRTFRLTNAVDPRIGYVIAGGVVAVIAIGSLVAWLRERRLAAVEAPTQDD